MENKKYNPKKQITIWIIAVTISIFLLMPIKLTVPILSLGNIEVKISYNIFTFETTVQLGQLKMPIKDTDLFKFLELKCKYYLNKKELEEYIIEYQKILMQSIFKNLFNYNLEE